MRNFKYGPESRIGDDHSIYGLPMATMIKSTIEVFYKHLWPILSGNQEFDSYTKAYIRGENDHSSNYYVEHSYLFDNHHRRLRSDENSSSSYGIKTSSLYKESPSSGVVDYSILSVAVLTLGLLLAVEFLLHQLDHLAHHRRFFQSVVTTFYKELAILGIVEWAVYLLQSYYKGMDKAKKSLFEKVHFALFYTAILNVVTSGLIYIGCRMETHRLWVKTEELELDHYIELREEFDRIQMKIAKIESKDSQGLKKRLSPSPEQHDEAAEEPFSMQAAWRNVQQRVRHPLLVCRYNKLLLQIRFHELRMHFIKANGLPIKFRVSEYLYKCEQSVLSHCVHLSSFTWIILMAISNLTYFLMSMVVVGTGELTGTEVGMTVIFYAACGGMVVLSLVMLRKVKWIFSQIMHKKLIDCTRIGEVYNRESSPISILKTTREPTTFRQIDLFWFQNPHAIIRAIQFMQFGYAIVLSTCIIFWSDINKATKYEINSSLTMTLVCLSCTGLFLFLTTRIVPRYTLCTNLGQLVNKKRLLPMVASYRLEELVKRREREIKDSEDQQKLAMLKASSKPINLHKRGVSNETCRFEQLAELVAKPTDSLPKISPDERRTRRARKKAFSDGVAAMRSFTEKMNESSVGMAIDVEKKETLALTESKHEQAPRSATMRRGRNRVVSEGVNIMHADFLAEHDQKKSIRRDLQIKMDSVIEDIPIMTRDHESLKITVGRSFAEIDCNKDIQENTGSIKVADNECDSDVEDIPVVTEKEISKSSSFCHKLQVFLMSARYSYFSGLLGTMTCFFIVNLRIEFLLVYGDVLTIKTWLFESFNPTVFFWMELSLLLYFAAESIGMVYLFSKNRDANSSVGMQISGFIGMLLAISCTVLLLTAEAIRSPSYGPYGSRFKGGVGNIEPFTGMIALYFLRLPLGPRIAALVERRMKHQLSVKSSKEGGKHNGACSGIMSEVGTPVELWQKAIAIFPEIVDTYGEFSSELLQAMLGVPLLPNAMVHSESKHKAKATKLKSTLSGLKDIANSIPEKAHFDMEHNNISTVSAVQMPLPSSILSPEVQAIIFSGQTGHPMKAICGESTIVGTTSEQTVEGLMSNKELGEKHWSKMRRTISAPHIKFEIDETSEQKERESDKENTSILIEPNAPLIRSMRRCERKLPSILDHWAVVDVALTRYELVYFDAAVHDEIDSLVVRTGDKIGFILNAIVATNGGKKLRLRDVALGRKIVGHVDLRKVDFVKLLRFPPSKKSESNVVHHCVESEVWKPMYSNQSDTVDVLASSKRRWERVQEDVIKLHSSHGVLLLRFFADLEFQENPVFSDGKMNDPIALLWCQTIGRICGIEQLRQDLPHFGQKGEVELSDYIHLSSRDQEHSTWSIIKSITSKALISRNPSFTHRNSLGNYEGGQNQRELNRDQLRATNTTENQRKLSETVEALAKTAV